MRFDLLGRLDDESFIGWARGAALAFAMLAPVLGVNATEGLGDAGPVWKFLDAGLPFWALAALIYFVPERLSPAEERSGRVFVIVALLAVACFALAFKATDARILAARAETGVWGFVYVLSSGLLNNVLLLWLLAVKAPSRPSSRLAVGVIAAAVFFAARVAIEAHEPDDPFVDEAWRYAADLSGAAIACFSLVVAATYPRVPRRLGGLAVAVAAIAVLSTVVYVTATDARQLWWIPVSLVTTRLQGALLLLALASVLSPRVVLAAAIALVTVTGVYAIDATSEVLAASRFWFLLQIMAGSAATVIIAVLLVEVARRSRNESDGLGAEEERYLPGPGWSSASSP